MHTSTLLSSVLFAAITLASPTRRADPEVQVPKALYFIDNSANNNVVALGLDGTSGQVTKGANVATGGKGLAAKLGNNQTDAGPDSLFSQSPITVADNMVFAVNPGSNDMTAFAINPNDATQLTQLGNPVKVPGTFPNTIHASNVNKIVCVGTTGSKNGMSCAKYDPKAAAAGKAAVGAFDGLRSFNLQQSDPPVGPQNTLSQVLFVSDQDAIRTFVKGDGKNTTSGLSNGFIAEFPVQNGTVSQTATKTPGPPGSLLFGSQDLPKRNGIERTLVSDGALGVRVFHYDENGGAHQDAALAVGPGTPCWTAFSKFTQKGYVSQVDNNKIAEVDFDLGQISRNFNNNDGNSGFTDMVAAGKFVYALNPGTPAKGGQAGEGAAVSQIDVSGQTIKEVKSFDISSNNVINGRPAGMAAQF